MRAWKRGAALLAALAALGGGATGARAQNAQQILSQTQQAYERLSDLQLKASVTESLRAENKTLRSASLLIELAFKRPNKLRILRQEPRGTVTIVSDGTNLFIYYASASQYIREAAAPTMAKLQPQLMEALRVMPLDPLGFLCRTGLPPGLENPKLAGKSRLNGRPVYIVTAIHRTQTTKWKNRAGRVQTLMGTTSIWKWWIDTETFLIQKYERYIKSIPVVLQEEKKNTIVTRKAQAAGQIRYLVLESSANTGLADSQFAFEPPKGATERQNLVERGNR
jgi:outer membrane lipoprotein-sorting protein